MDYYTCEYAHPRDKLYCRHNALSVEPVAIEVNPKECKKCKLYKERRQDSGRTKKSCN